MPARPSLIAERNPQPVFRLFRTALALSLTLSALSFFLFTWRWPLVGDASLIHYIGFLIERGWAPYRQLGDMNMPGSFLIEIAAMHLFGPGALAWRLFDFTLLALASAAFFIVCPPIRTPNLTPDRDRNRVPHVSARADVGLLTPPATPSINSPPPGAPFVTASSSPVGSTKIPGAPFMTTVSSWVGSHDRFLAPILASSLFILIHGRDGLAEGGQRDLTMAVCLIAATAFLFRAVRRASSASAAAFGLLSGVALTIKPTAALLTLAQLLLAVHSLQQFRIGFLHQPPRVANRSILKQYIAPATLAWLIAPAIALAFLLKERALPAFLAGFHGILPYYASLGHRPFTFVLLHSVSPLLPLVPLWIASLALLHPTFDWTRDWQRAALVAGISFGLINCIVQQRALPYYRYPLLVFLLPLMALDFTRILDLFAAPEPGAPPQTAPPSAVGSRRILHTILPRIFAIAALAFASFFLAPQSAILIHRYQWSNTDFISSLEANLNALGGPSLSGRIQCIDSISGCGNVLYRMSLEPATGVLSDFLLFGAVSDTQPPDSIPILRDTRAQFLAAMLANPPQVIVVTSHLHIDGPDNFEKLARWPAFADFLADRYTLQTQWSPTRTARWWSREETPASYRIYVLR